ncbi:amidase family protein [Streptomyces sp. NBC_00006]|uniref:amidase family protein n=1 Tax=Streptomyces sp. NBC_00006 TaxID=2975619 RepID=UPI00224D93AA|nr:amidase family protein [Streptomyces sp. NBC_00006]MCX5535943.1 amidase family protein [Streptomyces sp. NBC_00006]
MQAVNRRGFLTLAAAAGAGAVLPLGARPASAAPRPGTHDPTVWREFGDPLVAATGHGPLSGFSVAVKDLFAVEGHRVGAGNPAWLAESRPQAVTAAAVAALLAAGADVAGIARTDEFAYSLAGTNGHYGTPPNPAAPDRISGGSTSGPASAVALGQADIGLGTDTGGSIRIPSSYQGLYGIRPSHGAVSTAGLLPLAPSFDTVGWIARDASTLRAAGRVLLPRPEGPMPSGAVLAQDIVDVASTEVAASVRRAVAGWRRDRVADLPRLRTVRFDASVLPGWVRAFQTKQGVEAWRRWGPWVSRHWDSLNPDVRARFETASAYTSADLAAAERVLREARDRVDDLLGDRILLLPSASSVAPTREEASIGGPAIEETRAQTFQLTCLAGLTGRCAVSIPIRSRTAPVGLCLVGPRGSDRHLLDLAVRVAAAGVASR